MKLTAEGYDVLTAEDGGGAVNLARREKPDLILLDISFPPMSPMAAASRGTAFSS